MRIHRSVLSPLSSCVFRYLKPAVLRRILVCFKLSSARLHTDAAPQECSRWANWASSVDWLAVSSYTSSHQVFSNMIVTQWEVISHTAAKFLGRRRFFLVNMPAAPQPLSLLACVLYPCTPHILLIKPYTSIYLRIPPYTMQMSLWHHTYLVGSQVKAKRANKWTVAWVFWSIGEWGVWIWQIV